MEVMLAQVLSFAAVVMLVMAIRRMLRPAETRESTRPGVFGLLFGPAEEVGRVLEPMMTTAFPEKVVRIHNALEAAALQSLTVKDIIGMQGLLGVSLLLVTLIGIFSLTLKADLAIALGLIFGLVGWAYPSLWLNRAATSRQAEISKALPYSLDLLTVAMQAGQDFGVAVRFLIQEGPAGALRDEFRVMLQQIELGKSRVESLKAMATRIQLDNINALVTSIVQSSEMGASVTETLRIQAEETRRARFHQAERKAARSPSLMMIPVALFILPAVFIIIITPIALKLTQTFGAVK